MRSRKGKFHCFFYHWHNIVSAIPRHSHWWTASTRRTNSQIFQTSLSNISFLFNHFLPGCSWSSNSSAIQRKPGTTITKLHYHIGLMLCHLLLFTHLLSGGTQNLLYISPVDMRSGHLTQDIPLRDLLVLKKSNILFPVLLIFCSKLHTAGHTLHLNCIG